MDTPKIHFRWMKPDEVTKIEDIDRSERIRSGYQYIEGELQQIKVNWDSPPWSIEGDGEYSVAAQIHFCREHLQRKGRMYGAFVDDKLVGIGLIQQAVAAGTAQLAFLHVSKAYRQCGLGRQIAEALMAEAKKAGAKRMYVSAVPSESAVGFYLSQGFEPTDTPIPTLFELEPEDIHMVKVFETG
jgi:GNAT superfamily N-acetyltransferase